MRMKAQLERLQADISTIARKTGITSATQLAKLVPKDAHRGHAHGEPDVEWWDAHIMAPGVKDYDEKGLILREGAITNLIEHPIQMMPLEPNKPSHVPVFLTAKERKKLRRQNRREAWKEKQVRFDSWKPFAFFLSQADRSRVGQDPPGLLAARRAQGEDVQPDARFGERGSAGPH